MCQCMDDWLNKVMIGSAQDIECSELGNKLDKVLMSKWELILCPDAPLVDETYTSNKFTVRLPMVRQYSV
ncbi:hypothetical protein L208DRAFT_1407075, partial [Tricholoma matsutake]